MLNSRRTLLALGATTALAGLVRPALAADADPRMAERSIGSATAPVVVTAHRLSGSCVHAVTSVFNFTHFSSPCAVAYR